MNKCFIVKIVCSFCLERFPLLLGAWDGLRYFIVAQEQEVDTLDKLVVVHELEFVMKRALS